MLSVRLSSYGGTLEVARDSRTRLFLSCLATPQNQLLQMANNNLNTSQFWIWRKGQKTFFKQQFPQKVIPFLLEWLKRPLTLALYKDHLRDINLRICKRN